MNRVILTLGAILLAITISTYTGYIAGDVTEITIEPTQNTYGGTWGFFLGTTSSQQLAINGNAVNRSDLSLTCNTPSTVFFSTADPSTINISNVTGATVNDIATYYNTTFSANATYVLTEPLTLANTTHQGAAVQAGAHTTVALNAAGTIFFGTNVNISTCYNGDTCAYEALLPAATYNVWTDPTAPCNANLTLSGTVTNTTGAQLPNVTVTAGVQATTTDANGTYTFTVPPRDLLITASKDGYRPFNTTVTVSTNTTLDITLTRPTEPTQEAPTIVPSGSPRDDTGGQKFIETPSEFFDLVPDELHIRVREDRHVQRSIQVISYLNKTVRSTTSIQGPARTVADAGQLLIRPQSTGTITVDAYGNEPGIYDGLITARGELNAAIPLRVTVIPDDHEGIFLDVTTDQQSYSPDDTIDITANMANLEPAPQPVTLTYTLTGTETVWEYTTNVVVSDTLKDDVSVDLPDGLEGQYTVRVEATTPSTTVSDTTKITITDTSWIIWLLAITILLGFATLLYEHHFTVPEATLERASDELDVLERTTTTAFHLDDGTSIHSLKELHDALDQMSDETFNHHVGPDHNHFADWLRHEFDDRLANMAAMCTTQAQLQRVINAWEDN